MVPRHVRWTFWDDNFTGVRQVAVTELSKLD